MLQLPVKNYMIFRLGTLVPSAHDGPPSYIVAAAHGWEALFSLTSVPPSRIRAQRKVLNPCMGRVRRALDRAMVLVG